MPTPTKILITNEDESAVFYPQTNIDSIIDKDNLLLKSSTIDMLGGDNAATCSITLTDNVIYKCNPSTTLTINVPTDMAKFESCIVYFTYITGNTTTVTIPPAILCSGNNCASNVFTPIAGYKYTIGFYKEDTSILCIIDSVAL